MLAPNSPVCDENKVPVVQKVHRKSVGRTPLKVLTGQHLAVPDPNSLINKRSTLTKTTRDPVLTNKDTIRVGTGKPINVWIDTCHNNNLPESSDTETNSSRNLLPCSLITAKELILEETRCSLTNNDQSSQSCADILQSHPISSVEEQCYETENFHSLQEEHNTLPNLPPDIVANAFTEKPEHPTLEDVCQRAADLSNLLPLTNSDALLHTMAGSSLKLCTLPEASSINYVNINLAVNNNGTGNVSNSDLDFCKTESVSISEKEDLLQYKTITEDCEVLDEAEPNIVCTNDTYVKDPYIDGAFEQSFATALPDMLSDLTFKIEKCKIFAKEDEECYQHVLAEDTDPVVSGLPIEKLSSTLQDTFVDDLKPGKLIDASAGMGENPHIIIGPVVPDEATESLLPGLSSFCLPDDDHLTGLLPIDHEMFSHNTEECTRNNNLNMLQDVNKDFEGSIKVTPGCIVTAPGDCVESQSTWLTPISNIHQTCQSNQSSGPQKSTEDVSSPAYDCPTPVISTQSRFHDIPLFSRSVFKKVTPRMLASPCESGTSMTPILTSDGVTWTTPIMLLNRSMNTSLDTVCSAERSAKDNASETDALLWNFTRETLCNASREELMDRLEGSLIIVEVLSRELQGWQQAKVSSKPSEQRECATQTCVTYCTAEEQHYHNLYLKTLSKLQSLQHWQEEEKHLQHILKEVTENLVSYNSEAASMIDFAENLYESTQKDRGDLNQNVSCARTLLEEHLLTLAKANQKVQDCLLQRDEMRARMEDANCAKEAANQCLEDLEIHSSAIIAELRRDLESETQFCNAVKEAYKQQLSYNEELVGFVDTAQSVCTEMDDDRTQLLSQCSEARLLMSQHWRLFEIMKKKTQTALEEYEEIKNERDMAILENDEVFRHLKNEKSQNEQVILENSRLGSELETLMGFMCKLESEIEQLRDRNSELVEQSSAKDSSLKLLEKELNEATVRGQEYQDRIKFLSAEILPSLERNLSEALSQKKDLQTQLKVLKKENASQIAYYTETLEFLERENGVCREQVSETESQLKTHHLTLLERNFQCENLKDTVKELQTEVNELHEKLSNTKDDAQNMVTKMSKEISDSSEVVSKIRSHLLEHIENRRESANGETKAVLFGPHTPGGSLVLHNNFHEEHMNATNLNATDSEDQTAEGIWSKTSAFTVVLPVASPSPGTPQVNLEDLLHELSNTVTEVITNSSYAIDANQKIIEEFKKESACMKKELQNEKFRHTSDIRNMQLELDELRRRNCILDEKVNSKEKCITQLQEVITQQEQKILQQFSKAKASEALIEENEKLQLSLKLCENEVQVLKAELAQSPADAARNWIQEKLLLHKELATLKLKLVDTDCAKSETVQRLMRHIDILTTNLHHSEAEVHKLDNIIEKIRMALRSVPDVTSSDILKQLVEFLN
ncbi:sperm-associated antigen 5 [Pseudophryne corroboree]|uniref:sperm-associated antigen 5 n=1 Tax=Pseudophryne corroboree TaxID=495146 RepID=UPI003081BB80